MSHRDRGAALTADGSDDHLILTNDSLVSNQSLISAANSMSSDSGQELDSRDHLADEFDQYKDQNLEKMRTDVEGTVSDMDGMMNHALINALMDDGEDDDQSLRWGGASRSTEIEASVLCDINDWLKRKENPSVDERRAFMQENLNKMVSSVRYGIITPDDASRTVHGCAAMLRLELAEKIPETAIIITGMRKMVKNEDVIDAFKEFGDIEDAAVSPNARGFGVVRFVSPKSVNRAMDRFRTGEIVVQDVGVMIRVLKSDDMPDEGLIHSRSIAKGNLVLQQQQQQQQQQVPRASSVSSRVSAMEAHHGADLDTIGYPGGEPFLGSVLRGPTSDAGRSGNSGRSRSSNRSHTRKLSGVGSDR